MRHTALIMLFVSITIVSFAGSGNDRMCVGRNAYIKNRISVGKNHSFEIRNGELWAWGANASGGLGVGHKVASSIPLRVGTENDWVDVKGGLFHSLGIRANGTLWAWGENTNGQLGIGNTNMQKEPVQVGSANDWVYVEAGREHSFAIKSNGTLWAWGDNIYGQLGDGTILDRLSPVQIGFDSSWVKICSGDRHSIGLKSDGSIWTWGTNYYGQLGNAQFSYSGRINPEKVGSGEWIDIAAGGYYCLALRSDGTIWAWGNNQHGRLGDGTTVDKFVPVQVGTDNDWSYVAAGDYIGIGIKSNGSIWTWGNGITAPKLFDSSGKWVSACSGFGHVLGMKANGSVYSWGANGSGQLGDNTVTNKNTPVQINVANEWLALAVGNRHTIGIKADGSLWTWGMNDNGQLGIGNFKDSNRITPINTTDIWKNVGAGCFHSMAIKSDGTLWVWGSNSSGQLGIGNTTTKTTPVQVGNDTNWVSIAAGESHSLGIKSNGTLWGWGRNTFGQLGDSTYIDKKSPVQIGVDSNWACISAGSNHSFGIKTDGTLWAWGDNGIGQLGDGTLSKRKYPVQIGADSNWVSLATGPTAYSSLAIKADGTLWAWGDNNSGQLGIGNSSLNSVSPVQVGVDKNWISVVIGGLHSAGLKSDGTLWVWGYNLGGQHGNGTYVNTNKPVIVGIEKNWVNVIVGYDFTIGIKAQRDQLCATGANIFGQLGNGTNINRNTFTCKRTPAYVYASPETKTLCQVGTTYFRVKAKYAQWYKWQVNTGSGWVTLANNSVYNGVGTDSLVLNNINTTYNDHWYRCVLYNVDNDSTMSDSAKLTIVTPMIITRQPTNDTVCEGSRATFYTTASGTNINYQWQEYSSTSWIDLNNSASTAGATTDTLILTGVQSNMNGNKYRCVLNASCGQVDTSSVIELTVESNKVSSVSILSNDTSICVGDQVVFTATHVNGGNAPFYQWLLNGVNVGTNSSNFTVTAPNNNDQVRCYMTTSLLCGSPKTAESNIINLEVTPYVTPTISITSDAGSTWCSGKENIFRSISSNGGISPVYQWKINGTDIGVSADTLWMPYLNDGDIIECQMTSSLKCKLPENASSNKINMTVLKTTLASIVISPNPDSIVCKNDLVTLFGAFTNGGTTPAFQWMLNGADIPGQTNGTLTTNSLKDGDVINCRLISSGVCVFPEVSNAIGFEVRELLQPKVTVDIIYIGKNAYQFFAKSTNGGKYPTYLWYSNGRLLKKSFDDTITLHGLNKWDKIWVEMVSNEPCITKGNSIVNSNIITTGINGKALNNNLLDLYPNPNNGSFKIKGELGIRREQEISIAVMNNVGQIIYREKIQLFKGVLNHNIEINKDQAQGNYLIRLDFDGESMLIPFVLIK